MRRTQLQVDEASYEMLRRRAYERGVSMSALLREVLAEYFAPARSQPRFEDLTFVGAASSIQGELEPVSERHDEALAEALYE